MNFEYNSSAGFLLFVVGIIFIILAIVFAVKIAYSQEIESYEDCIKQKIHPPLCNAMFPPMTLQNINWTLPFP